MIIFKHATELKKIIHEIEDSGSKIGFVPTMGALHEGHLSLLQKSKEMCDKTVCSIFVNPTQFNNPEDLAKYPKTITEDILKLEENGCDILFLPDEKEIYPNESSKKKQFDLGFIETVLEGKFRPGHFQGVALVVEKLLNIVNPGFLFLGQKDLQQCLVIKKLIQISGKKTQIVICPILREKTGLAMSSRNLRLSPEDRQLASNLHQALLFIKDHLSLQNFESMKKQAVENLESKGFKVEYLELAKAQNLEVIHNFVTGEKLVILIAAYLREVRLIDNLVLDSSN